MLFRWDRNMRTFCFCIALMFGFAELSPSMAQEKRTISGILQKIDVQTGAITIQPIKTGGKELQSFSLLDPKMEVTLEPGKAKLSDLVKGNVVHLTLLGDHEVEAIRAEVPVIRGALTEVQVANKTVSVLADDLTKAAVVVDGQTKIKHLGKEVAISDLKVNQWVEITTTLNGKSALAIDAQAAGSTNGRVPSGKLYGSIVALDTKEGNLIFRYSKGKERLLSFGVPKNVTTWLVVQKKFLEDLEGPLSLASRSAIVYLASDREQVVRILVEPTLVRCQVKQIDASARTLVVEQNGETKTWRLPDDLLVMNGKRKVRLSDVPVPGAVELALSLDGKRLCAILIAK